MSVLSQHETVQFPAGDGYRFVVVKTLTFTGDPDGRSLLVSLIGHRDYRDTFLTPDSAQHDSVDMHGPFVLSDIRPQNFEPVDGRSVHHAVEAFWSDPSHKSPMPEATQKFTRLLSSIDLANSTCFRLTKPAGSPEHLLSHTLRDGFQEFVVINPAARTVALLILGVD